MTYRDRILARLRYLAATASDERSKGCYLHAAEEVEMIEDDTP